VIAAVVVVVAATAGHPAPGLHGDGRGVLLALVAFAVGLVGAREARLRRAPARVQALLVTLLAGSAALMWLQPDGPGFLGFFYLATWLATLRLPGRLGLAAAGLALAAGLAVVRAAGAHRPLTGIVLSALT
jgi:hypothetical protein